MSGSTPLLCAFSIFCAALSSGTGGIEKASDSETCNGDSAY